MLVKLTSVCFQYCCVFWKYKYWLRLENSPLKCTSMQKIYGFIRGGNRFWNRFKKIVQTNLINDTNWITFKKIVFPNLQQHAGSKSATTQTDKSSKETKATTLQWRQFDSAAKNFQTEDNEKMQQISLPLSMGPRALVRGKMANLVQRLLLNLIDQ
jgi:hypothetical protein